MKTRLSILLKFPVQLAGISCVIEVLSSSFKDDLSAQVHDLHQLQESVVKTKQVWLQQNYGYHLFFSYPFTVFFVLFLIFYILFLKLLRHIFVYLFMNDKLYSPCRLRLLVRYFLFLV